jgi:hypothetical protein
MKRHSYRHGLTVRKSPASKELNLEAEESTALGAVTKQRLVKTADREGLVRSIVDCTVCKLAMSLQLLVVTSFKSPIDPITNPNPVSSHLTRDNM